MSKVPNATPTITILTKETQHVRISQPTVQSAMCTLHSVENISMRHGQSVAKWSDDCVVVAVSCEMLLKEIFVHEKAPKMSI